MAVLKAQQADPAMGNTPAVDRTVHVVAHTHWDREWYLTFQQFRIYLVKLVDRLLEILDDDHYQCFLLDGQTVVLEDYLEIRPENAGKLAVLIRSGRLFVGPWYVLPDLFLVSGESIIRNLELGIRVASRFGEPMPVGYMPDQFGFITQMPQILRGFGIEEAVVWRGFPAAAPAEIWWQAPDRSRVLTHKLNAAGGYLNAAELSHDSSEKALQQVREAVDRMGTGVASNQFLLMHGVDHRFPDPRLPQTVAALNSSLDDLTVKQSTLPKYFRAVRKHPDSFPVVQGEQRKGEKMEMLQGTLSTRMYLKQANERVETLLAHVAEPLCSFAWLLGAPYPMSLLQTAWEELLRNHAHDSICGCSLDEVHREMLTRFSSAQQIADTLCHHATKQIGDALSQEGEERTPHLMVFNTLPWARTEAVEAQIILPDDPSYESFSLVRGGKYVAYSVLSDDRSFVVFNPADALDSFPSFDAGRRRTVRFVAEDVPAWGYVAIEIRPGEPAPAASPVIRDFVTDCGLPGVETESLRLAFNADGTFDLADLRSGQEFPGLQSFEDSGDCGDEYSYCPPAADLVINTLGAAADVSTEVCGERFRTFKVQWKMQIPSNVVREESTMRSEETDVLSITSHITVAAGVPRVDIVTEVENTARHHRLRAVFPTGTGADASFAESAFDIVERPVALPQHEGWTEDPQPIHPQLTFAGARSQNRSLTIANQGLTEYELCGDEQATFALTLLRCVEWGSRGDLTNTKRAHRPDGSPGTNYMFTPEAECLGTHQFHYSVIPGSGNTDEGYGVREAYGFKVGMVAHQRKLPPGSAPEGSFGQVRTDACVAPSALRVSDGGDELVVRLANMARAGSSTRIGLRQGIAAAAELNLAGARCAALPVREGGVDFDIEPKSIYTLGLKPETIP